ncbi:MAG: GNAT family N-acetyltransferase [Candidatus Thorarchaeota archaeon]
MNAVVRDYQESDWNEVEQMILNAENFGVTFLEHEKLRIDVFAHFPTYGRVLIAFDSENMKVVGYAAVQFEWKALVINSMITHHEYLRMGIGHLMMKRIMEIGQKQPIIDVIRVDTGDFMEYAQKFYLSCGFERAGHVPHYLSWNNHQVVFVYHVQK